LLVQGEVDLVRLATREVELRSVHRLGEVVWQPLAPRLNDSAKHLRRILPLAARHSDAYLAASDDELRAQVPALRSVLRRRGFATELVAQSFALLREVAARTLGQRHFDVQMMTAWALVQGRLAEMATGEGKTLTATLAAGTAALAGIPVHVITVNDYLAQVTRRQ
jgi:preprotein translocase subunit SecA